MNGFKRIYNKAISEGIDYMAKRKQTTKEVEYIIFTSSIKISWNAWEIDSIKGEFIG